MNVYIWEEIPPLNFTANTANSTVRLTTVWTPTAVTLETSTDWTNWNTYTIWDTITLSNIWDKVYFRNTSTTDTWFGTAPLAYYKFVMTWSIAWSGDVNYLINKNSTETLSIRCFTQLFRDCTALTTPPRLTATTLWGGCYQYMFWWCTNLVSLPKLIATTLANYCYRNMFNWCSKIKLSTSQTGDYQTPYRIPITWTWTDATDTLYQMFSSTWWTLTGSPSINTTYYTSNTVV